MSQSSRPSTPNSLARRNAQRIRDLGFESPKSLCECLGLQVEDVLGVVEQCESDYPYDFWFEPKKSGTGKRLIEHPHNDLKVVQQRLNRLLQRLELPRIFHGSIGRTSIKTNAEPHRRDTWFLAVDLADYYTSIRPDKVYGNLRSLGASPDIARLITRLTTIDHHVPQGAPTSPIVAAIAMLPLSRRLAKLMASIRGTVTIFGDNVSISCGRDLRRYRNTIATLVGSEGFSLRNEKTIIARPATDKLLPGLIIRERRITVADEDLKTVSAIVNRCGRMTIEELRYRVCPRLRAKLNGLVNHYSWVDRKKVQFVRSDFESIDWPDTHERARCETPTCQCLE